MPDDTAAAARIVALPTQGKPIIKCTAGDLHLIATRAERALIDAGHPIFQRGASLVRPAVQEITAAGGRTTTTACLVPVTKAALLDYLGRSAVFLKYDGRTGDDKVIDPPDTIAETILARFGEWRFPTIRGVITTPTLRPDHTILSEPGYDPATRLYLAEDPTLILPPVPAFPTMQQAADALTLLDELLDGFAFADQHDADAEASLDRAVALSALLTPVCRGAMSVAPLHVFRAPTPGSGKSFLADLASTFATGRPCPAASVSADPKELEKLLTGLLLSGFPLMNLDNANGILGSDLLCQAVERPTVRLRRLGGSTIEEIEANATMIATGNGLRVRGDLVRRSIISNLDARVERPELRTFSFNPIERVLADRGRYVAAALTVVRAFVTSGRADLTPLGSYAEWTATVRGALVWLGRPDPARSMETAREEDPELGAIRDVMTQWAQHIGIDQPATIKRFTALAELRDLDEHGRPTGDYKHADLRDALLAVARLGMTIDNRRFGKWLTGRRGRPVLLNAQNTRKLLRFERLDGTTDGAARWVLSAP